MHTRTITAAVLALGTTALLTACDPNATTGTASSSSAPAAASISPAGDTGTPAAAPKADTPTAAAATKVVPRFTGMGLQAAQDAAQDAGFYDLTSHDSSGRDRMQILDRDWKVCSQKPAAGTKASVDTKLDFGAVKTDESCPATDKKPPAKAGSTMPNLVGKGLNTATEALPADASIDSTDASGQDRIIIVQSNWQVCTQSPAPGAPLSGQPVKLTAVKFGEGCP